MKKCNKSVSKRRKEQGVKTGWKIQSYYFFPALVFFLLPWDQGEHDSYSVVENRNSSPVNLIESDENGCEVDFYNK